MVEWQDRQGFGHLDSCARLGCLAMVINLGSHAMKPDAMMGQDECAMPLQEEH